MCVCCMWEITVGTARCSAARCDAARCDAVQCSVGWSVRTIRCDWVCAVGSRQVPVQWWHRATNQLELKRERRPEGSCHLEQGPVCTLVASYALTHSDLHTLTQTHTPQKHTQEPGSQQGTRIQIHKYMLRHTHTHTVIYALKN